MNHVINIEFLTVRSISSAKTNGFSIRFLVVRLCLQYQFEFQIQLQTNFIRLLDYHSYKRCSIGFRSKLWYYVLHLHAWVNFDVYTSYIFYHMALCFFHSAEWLACNSMCICFRRNSIFPCDFRCYQFSKSNKRK